ncbi:TonB-dependent receptor plug domain-containing protein [Teredinibacter purpureus]|uniref:TonB-dependent receptor plug domain-containing protein n=1 Tax=Teredinibacter purpureus TaxID=2731756 RepID=UPI0005F79260|nr:TonB-dependent receptor [Teredinibacter purpureus]
MKHLFQLSLLSGLTLGLSLSAVAQEKLEEIVVTASGNQTPLREVGASVSVITAEQIALQGSTALMDIMRNQIGVSVTNSGGMGKQSSLRIRGEEGYRTLIMIDGVEMSDPTGTQVGTEVQHLQTGDEIERVEILRGPQGFIYGADAGGVVNIFTTTSEEGFNGHVAAQAGAFDTRKLTGHLGFGGEQGDILISVADLSSEGFNARTDDTNNEADGYDNTTVHTKFGWNINDTLRTQLVFRDLEALSEYDNCGSAAEDCVTSSEQQTGRLSFEWQHGNAQHALAFGSTAIEREFFTDNLSSYSISGVLEKSEYLGSVELSPFFTTVFGADYKTEKVGEDANTFTHIPNLLDVFFDIDEEIDTITRNQTGLFAELQANIDDTLYFTGGLRNDNNDDFGTHNSVRVTAAWLPIISDSETLKTRASAGTGFRAPSLQEIAYNKGPWAFGAAADVALKEEKSAGIDAGIEYYHQLKGDTSYSVETTLFYQTVDNEIYFDPIDWSGYFQADGESSSKGIELAGEYTMSSRYALIANATYNKTETRDDAPRVRRPQYTYNVSVNASLMDNNLNLLANMRYVTDVEDINDVAMDDYSVFNLSANWRWHQWVFNARIENLLDQDYQEVTGYNTAERSLYAGAKFQF